MMREASADGGARGVTLVLHKCYYRRVGYECARGAALPLPEDAPIL